MNQLGDITRLCGRARRTKSFHTAETTRKAAAMKCKNGSVGSGVGFERIRRITGYLVGTLDRWNSAKKAEEHDRVKHGLGEESEKRKAEVSTRYQKQVCSHR